MLITHYEVIMSDKSFLNKIISFYMVFNEGHQLKNAEFVLANTPISGYVENLEKAQ